MRRTERRLGLFAACIAMMQAAFAAAPAPREIPRRVVSLDLCSDWMLLDYAPRERVAALSAMRAQWHVRDAWPQDWPTHDGSLERILALKPDLVVTGQFNALLLRERLKQLGVRVEVLPLPTRLDQVGAYETQFLNLLGLPASRAHAPLPMSAAHAGRRLLLLDANGVGIGGNTLEDDVLRRAGWENYLREDGFVSLDAERIVVDPPDALAWSASKAPALANRFAEQPALQRAIPRSHWLRSDNWRWQCPGPWTWDLVRELEQAAPREGVSP